MTSPQRFARLVEIRAEVVALHEQEDQLREKAKTLREQWSDGIEQRISRLYVQLDHLHREVDSLMFNKR